MSLLTRHNVYLRIFSLSKIFSFLLLSGSVSLFAMDAESLKKASHGEAVKGSVAVVFHDGSSGAPAPRSLLASSDPLEIKKPSYRYGDPYAEAVKLNDDFFRLSSDAKDRYLRQHARWKALESVMNEIAEGYQIIAPHHATALPPSVDIPRKDDGDLSPSTRASAGSSGEHRASSRTDEEKICQAIGTEVWREERLSIPNRLKMYENREINQLYAKHNTGPIRRMLAPLDKHIMTPYSLWYERNAHLINSAAKLMFMMSAAAVVFHHMGGTEWVKRKIREAFDRPSIYTVQAAKSISDDKRRAAGQQLVLSPEVQRNVNEIVETVRWYNNQPKERQREYKLKGALLYGPPGTGKTSLARAIAHRTGWNLIELMADDFNKIKHTADKIIVLEEMFVKARKMGKTMIFLDELENLVLDRDKGESPLLRKMLEFGDRGDVFIIGATNRFFDIDPAFRRRLRYHIEVKSPTTRMRYQIIDNYVEWLLRQKGYAYEADSMQLAQQLQGKSGAHIESLVERMRDRARLYGNTVIDNLGEERLLVDDHIAQEILVDMGIIEPESEDDVLDRDAIMQAERTVALED
ncbi:MAG: AAA family ATPase [Candidatus Dependentiae bacterium]|jgi:hypothetical protein